MILPAYIHILNAVAPTSGEVFGLGVVFGLCAMLGSCITFGLGETFGWDEVLTLSIPGRTIQPPQTPLTRWTTPR